MNLFRPFQMGEPQRDERGRLVGIDRYQDVLGRCWKRFAHHRFRHHSGLPAPDRRDSLGHPQQQCAGAGSRRAGGRRHRRALPGLPVRHRTPRFAGCTRLRDAPGSWAKNYRRSFAQNARASLLPGALTGLFLGSSAFTGMLFFGWGLAAPSTGTVALFLFSWLVFLVLSTLYWPQLVLFDQRASVRLRNALLFTIRHFWLTLAWPCCSWSGGC